MKQFIAVAVSAVILLMFQNCSDSGLVLPTQVSSEAAPEQKIEITSQPQDQSVVASQTVEFTVQVNSNDGVTFQWYFGDQMLNGETSSTLQIDRAQLGHIGDYFVVVMKDGEPVLTSQPGHLEVSSPVLGNLTMAIGLSGENVGNGATLAICPAGTVKVSNVSVQNIPAADNGEGAPAFVDYALCEKDNLLGDQVALSTDSCATFGGVVVAETTYKNVSDQDEDQEAPVNVLLSVCDKSNSIDANSVDLTLAGCAAGQSELSNLPFQNIGNFEGGNPGAELNLAISFCGQ